MEEFDDLDELKFGGDCEELSDLLQVGNNFCCSYYQG
jgi:hypothetical protein